MKSSRTEKIVSEMLLEKSCFKPYSTVLSQINHKEVETVRFLLSSDYVASPTVNTICFHLAQLLQTEEQQQNKLVC